MSQLSFSEVAALWKADKRKYVKDASYAIYSRLCNYLILPYFRDRQALDEQSIQAFANGLLEQGYSIKTVKDTMRVVKMIIRHGEKTAEANTSWTDFHSF